MESKIFPSEHSYFEIKMLINKLISKYPFVNISKIGKSVAGRDIPVLLIGSDTEYTAFIAGENPRCRITTLILLMFAEELCDKILNGKEMCGINMRKAMFGRGVAIMPCLNPDGAEISLRGDMGCGYMAGKIAGLCNGDFSKWEANLRGVEIVRNFAFDFKKRQSIEKENFISGPSYKGFSGYKPETEPETLALTELCRTKNIRHLINVTAFGNTVSYSGCEKVPKPSVKMADVISAVSSFKVSPPISKIYPEICDWFTFEFNRPGITLRIGEDEIPPASELTYWYERIKESLTLLALF